MTSGTSTRSGASWGRSELALSDRGRPLQTAARELASRNLNLTKEPGSDPCSSGRGSFATDPKGRGQTLAVRDVAPLASSGSPTNLGGRDLEPPPLADPRRRRDGVFFVVTRSIYRLLR